MSTGYVDWSYLDAFDGDFAPKQSGFRDKIDVLPDGGYDMEVVDAAPDMIAGKLVLRLGVRPLGGATFEWVHWLDSQRNVNALGADLAVFGFPADRWQSEGKKLRDVLPGVIPQLPGIKFRASKVTDRPQDGEYKGKVFHKLKVVARIGGNPMPAASPFAQPAPARPANGAAPQLDPSNPPF